MKTILTVIQILVAIGLISLILLQSSKGGLGSAFGGGGEFRSRRGAEVIIFRATIIFAIFFLVVSVANLFV
jgi:preprotein translocase subunit SecG